MVEVLVMWEPGKMDFDFQGLLVFEEVYRFL